MASSESASLEHKSASPPPATSTGFRAFNATNRLPPNPTVTRNVMMDLALSNPTFSRLYPRNQRKVRASIVATGVISYQGTPRDEIVSTLIRGCRLSRQALEPACSFPWKEWATKVSALTTPNMTSATTYKHAYTWTNTRQCMRDKLRRCTRHHRQSTM